MQGRDNGFVSFYTSNYDGAARSFHLSEMRLDGYRIMIKMHLSREVLKSKDVLEFSLKTLTRDCGAPSKVVITLDGKQTEFKCVNYSGSALPHGHAFNHEHGGAFKLNRKFLLEIGNAKDIQVKIHSDEDLYCDRREFQDHCRQFYNSVYDDTMFSESVARVSPRDAARQRLDMRTQRTVKLQELTKRRNKWMVAFFIAPIVIPFASLLFVRPMSHLLSGFWFFDIMVALILAVMWIVPQIGISEILSEINKECPKCHDRAITSNGASSSLYEVRQKKTIVTNRDGMNEIRTVSAHDYEITNRFECSQCFHKWSHSHIKHGWFW
jgi:hypothetical protein